MIAANSNTRSIKRSFQELVEQNVVAFFGAALFIFWAVAAEFFTLFAGPEWVRVWHGCAVAFLTIAVLAAAAALAPIKNR